MGQGCEVQEASGPGRGRQAGKQAGLSKENYLEMAILRHKTCSFLSSSSVLQI